MNKKSNEKTENKSIFEIYEEYHGEMKKMATLEDSAPFKFANTEFVEYFDRRLARLDTLMNLYADLMLSIRHDN